MVSILDIGKKSFWDVIVRELSGQDFVKLERRVWELAKKMKNLRPQDGQQYADYQEILGELEKKSQLLPISVQKEVRDYIRGERGLPVFVKNDETPDEEDIQDFVENRYGKEE